MPAEYIRVPLETVVKRFEADVGYIVNTEDLSRYIGTAIHVVSEYILIGDEHSLDYIRSNFNNDSEQIAKLILSICIAIQEVIHDNMTISNNMVTLRFMDLNAYMYMLELHVGYSNVNIDLSNMQAGEESILIDVL